jgi:hypothetical protein
VLAITPAARAQSVPPVTAQQTHDMVQAFIDAYNRHDLNGVLATVDLRSAFRYGDCDYVWHESYGAIGKGAFVQDLRDRFAENDHLRVTVFQGTDDNGPSPIEFGVTGTRTNDPIAIQGLPPQYFAAKGHVDWATGRIARFIAASQTACQQHDFPRNKPDPLRTRTIAQDFLDAYRARDTGRILQLASSKVRYTDYDYVRCQAVTVSGRAALKRLLDRRFGQNDRFTDAILTFPKPADPDIAAVRLTRLSRTIRARGLAPQLTRIALVLQRRNENFMGYFYRVARADITPVAGSATCPAGGFRVER